MDFSKLSLSERQSKLAKEIGIIVLGVLIALALGAVATAIGWHFEVRAARQQLRYELGHNLKLLQWWESTKGCTSDRLDELATVLAKASETRRLPPLGAIPRPPSGSWPRGVWDSQNAAQTAAHFPARELASVSRVYRLFEGIAESNRQLSDAWTALSMMSGPGRTLDEGTEAALYAALATARAKNDFTSQTVRRVLGHRLGQSYAQIDPENPPVITGARKICGGIGKPIAATYGSNAGP